MARSVAPETGVVARVPSTSALMIRGDTPRCSTRIPRNEPRTSDPSLRAMLLLMAQRWRDRAHDFARKLVFERAVRDFNDELMSRR